jgi:hypothetical protein
MPSFTFSVDSVKVKDGIKMVLSETISEVLPIVFFSKYLKPLKARKSHKPTLLA